MDRDSTIVGVVIHRDSNTAVGVVLILNTGSIFFHYFLSSLGLRILSRE